MYPPELGSNDKSFHVSRTILFFKLSSPRLTKRPKVPDSLSTLITSTLTLSGDPFTNEPSVLVEPEEL